MINLSYWDLTLQPRSTMLCVVLTSLITADNMDGTSGNYTLKNFFTLATIWFSVS